MFITQRNELLCVSEPKTTNLPIRIRSLSSDWSSSSVSDLWLVYIFWKPKWKADTTKHRNLEPLTKKSYFGLISRFLEKSKNDDFLKQNSPSFPYSTCTFETCHVARNMARTYRACQMERKCKVSSTSHPVKELLTIALSQCKRKIVLSTKMCKNFKESLVLGA